MWLEALFALTAKHEIATVVTAIITLKVKPTLENVGVQNSSIPEIFAQGVNSEESMKSKCVAAVSIQVTSNRNKCRKVNGVWQLRSDEITSSFWLDSWDQI